MGKGIGWAVERMQAGERVCRRGWHRTGMFIDIQSPDEHSFMTLPYVYLEISPTERIPWTVSQADLLAVDWELWGC